MLIIRIIRLVRIFSPYEDHFMITFTSIADLDKLADDDPAKAVIKQLLI